MRPRKNRVVSALLAEMLRKATAVYNDRWVAQTITGYKTTPRDETVAQHNVYWLAIARAAETSQYDEILANARAAGRFQSAQGFGLADAVGRTIEATNMIEIALLEASDGTVPAMEIINEIADLRSMIAMAVAEGYKEDQDERKPSPAIPTPDAKEKLREIMRRRASSFTTTELAAGDEVPPLYEGGMQFHFVDSGKLRLYNLLPNGRCITLSILAAGDVFLQWRAESQSLSCLCAEAMSASRVITANEADMASIIAAQPVAAVDVISNFARRLTESQVLIEDLLNNSVNLRLYRTLLELAKQFGREEPGGAHVIDYPLTHQRLADMIGSNRVTVTRKLQELQERGIVDARKNATIALRDTDALAKLAAAGSSA